MKVAVIADAEDHITEAAVSGSATNVVPAGALLAVTRSGILRRTFPVAVTTAAVALNQDLKALTPAIGIDPRFVAWLLRRDERSILEECTKDGTTVDSIDFPEFLKRSMPLAPFAEQQRIVTAIEEQFSRVDAGLRALERARQNLKRMRAAMLQAAVTGRLVPQDLSEGSGNDVLAAVRVTKQLSLQPPPSTGAHEALVTDPPSLPQNWAIACWATIGRSQNGRLFPSRDYSAEGIRLLRPGNLHASGRLIWTPQNTKCLPDQYASDYPGYIVGPHEIVMNLTAQSLRDEFLGRVCMTGSDGNMLLNQRIARLTPVGMNPRFVFWVFKSPLFRRFVDRLNTGSLIQHMFTSQLDQFVLPVPPRSEQIRIVAALERSMSVLNATEQILVDAEQHSSALRSSVLAAAFSGRLVPQDPHDEPAAVLLERIAAERAASDSSKSLTKRIRRTKAMG